MILVGQKLKANEASLYSGKTKDRKKHKNLKGMIFGWT
jgi:hypothetical protein